ncbi:YjcG family protein [Mesobacillus jeotgali]|jgi:2'-5' RNA ligase|uniref:Putative phosphoesterase RH061_06750 n=1 Tax=Mesobacillus jeotgali TaxID=129985 RepID=A0ABY9VJN9_9BACI|nr:YjcG family protein [Mesobacillus jeotgali]WNF24176.1 YjcG family protein [Mesobacillus jeotgali]
MKFGIVIFPSKKIQDFANSMRRRYDPHYALIPPHVTLKSSFEATEEEIKEIANKLDTIARNFKPINIQVTKIGSFKPVNNVIYLKIESPEDLERLHNELNATFDDGNQEYNFVPHITIGQKMSDDEHSDVYGSLRMTKVHYEDTADRIHLLYQLDNGSWTVYETFRLGKE